MADWRIHTPAPLLDLWTIPKSIYKSYLLFSRMWSWLIRRFVLSSSPTLEWIGTYCTVPQPNQGVGFDIYLFFESWAAVCNRGKPAIDRVGHLDILNLILVISFVCGIGSSMVNLHFQHWVFESNLHTVQRCRELLFRRNDLVRWRATVRSHGSGLTDIYNTALLFSSWLRFRTFYDSQIKITVHLLYETQN